MKKWYYMYVVECSDSSLYTGITTDIIRRLDEHITKPQGAKYTRSRRPVSIVYCVRYDNRSLASKAEAAFKKLSRQKKLEIINGQ